MPELKAQSSPFDVGLKVDNFLNSILDGFYQPSDVAPADIVEEELSKFRGAIKLLTESASEASRSIPMFASLIEKEPLILELVRRILALPETTAFVDGRRFGSNLPATKQASYEHATLIEDMGFWTIVPPPANFEHLLTVATVGSYARKRPYVANRNQIRKVSEIVSKALDVTNASQTDKFEFLNSRSLQPYSLRQADYVVGVNNKPVAAINKVFITNPGGSQSYLLRTTLPRTQAELAEASVQVILILDGAGLRRISRSVLEELFRSVYAVMTISQAEQGSLVEAMIGAMDAPTSPYLPVDRIIESVLNLTDAIAIDSLPMASDDARLALARYANRFPEQALTLEAGGERLRWTRNELVQNIRSSETKFDRVSVRAAFAKALDLSMTDEGQHDFENASTGIYSAGPNPILPAEFLVVSSSEAPSADLIRIVARLSLQKVPNAKLAVLIVPNSDREYDGAERRTLQTRMATNVVVLSANDLLGFVTGRSNPRDAFLQKVLQQSDLSKISPFVLNSVTPDRIYYGRQKEESTLLGTLTTNSVAVLGSRRIGKTSLLRHLEASLIEADFSPFFLDCQTVGNWHQFGEIAKRYWNVRVKSKFQPEGFVDIIRQLSKGEPKNVVIILDEIDQLLSWDTNHEWDNVPEAFFRTCRTISQNGDAQFVFSGERTIANKLWDPQSPHWNFCRPLLLKQLDEDDTRSLLLQPLKSLQVAIEDESQFSDRVWKITSGHPQITQFLGDKLVQLLNERNPVERNVLGDDDVQQITDTFEYKDHYLNTYWGQATSLEKLVSLLVIEKPQKPSSLMQILENNNVSEGDIMSALRMLDLYGIVSQEGETYSLKAEWLGSALEAYGGVEEALRRAREQT